MLLSRIITAALIGGGIAGIAGGLLHLVWVQPPLLHAELYENGEIVHFGAEAVNTIQPTIQPWGINPLRDSLSIGVSVILGVGYALILAAMMGLAIQRGHHLNTPKGLLWGLAGYASFHLAPAFSLPPETPGTAAADIAARQIWWFSTVALTATGCWIMAFYQKRLAIAVAAIAIMTPHIIGAPQPDFFTGTTPPEIASLFAARALGHGLIVWLMLGALVTRLMQTEPE